MQHPIQPWPPIIRRPELQPRLQRRLYQAVTLLVWLAWLYLFLPLATLLLWIAGLRAGWVEGGLASDPVNASAVRWIGAFALVAAAALVVWGEVDRRRYSARKHRRVREHGELKTISEGMQIRLADVYRLRDARLARVNFTPEGRVLRVDGLDRPGPSRRGEMNEMMGRLAEAVTESRSLEDLTRPLLELLEAATGFDSVYLTSINAEDGLQYILFSRNANRMRIPEGLAVPWQDTLCKRALEEDRFYTDDVGGVWADSTAARALGIQSYLSTPVHAGEQLYGTLCAASSQSMPMRPDVDRLVHLFAKLIGQHVERDAMLARLQQANLELNAVAMIDPLTGLANRRALIAEMVRMLNRSQRESAHLHVVFVDMDGFKAINDRLGHDKGDAFLAAAAARITSGLRAGDFAARYGGDEFVVLAEAGEANSAEMLRARIERSLAGRYDLGGITLDYPGASVGVATSQANEGPDALLARADEAMYAIKRQRREAGPRT